MAIVIDDIIRLWKMAKAANELNSLGNSPIARALRLSNRVDLMLKEYRAKVSPSREKEMKKELTDIKLELERMLTVVLSVPNVDGANKAINKGSEMLSTIQAAEFARLELLRIYWEQEEKHLPQDDPNPQAMWREKRQAYLRVLPMYKVLANQMTGAALRTQREIDQSRQNQNAAREAVIEVRRQNEKDAAEQLRMLQQDNSGFVNDERSAVVARERFLAVRKWANEQDQRIRELVEVGDRLFLAS
jgi:hypothetical protein